MNEYLPKSITLKNLITGETRVFAENNTTFILDSDSGFLDWGQVESKQVFVPHVNQVGSDLEYTAVNEPRAISIPIAIAAKSGADMANLKAILNRFVNPFHKMRLVVLEKWFMNFVPLSSIQYGKTYNTNNEVICRARIEGRAPLPLFSSMNPTLIEHGPSLPLKVFPMIIPAKDNTRKEGIALGRAAVSTRRIVTNNSDVPVGFTFTMTPSHSPISNPKIAMSDDIYMELKDVTLNLGDRLVIHTLYGEEYIQIIRKNGDVEDGMLFMTRASSVFLLPFGQTEVVVTANPELQLDNLVASLKVVDLRLEVQD